MSTATDDVETLVRHFADTLARRDAAGCADLWGDSASIVADAFDATPQTRAALEEFLAAAWPIYDYLNLQRIEHTILERRDLTESITRVRVRFSFFDGTDEHLTDGDFEYVLRRDDGTLRVYVGINIDAEPNLTALARARGYPPAT